MDSARPTNAKNLLSLKQASERLGVTPEILLNLNEYNILKPTITLSGEIGYTLEQIENFLIIQNLSGNANQVGQRPVASNPNANSYSNDMPQSISRVNRPTEEKQTEPNIQPQASNPINKNSGRIQAFLSISASSFVFFTILFFVFAQPSITSVKNDPQLSHKESNFESVSRSSVSTLNPSYSPLPSPMQSKTMAASSNGMGNQGMAISDTKLAVQKEIFEKKKIDALDDNFAYSSGIQPANEKNGEPTNARLNQLVDFSSSPSCPSCINDGPIEEKSIFDERGNIKGELSEKNMLAASSIGEAGINHNMVATRQSQHPFVLYGFSILALLSILYIFKNQLLYAPSHTGSIPVENNNYHYNNLEAQKILEVNQKTDGTVVIYLHGKEYKVSKPELDSESDQFISRLMELVTDNTKEVDYDTLSDGKIRFNTPLSKLVTRLGFVGIKRDLFFPRTSKNRLLFRKYITEQDLIAMSLTADQIAAYI